MKKKVSITKKELSRKVNSNLTNILPKVKPYYQNKYYVIYNIIGEMVSRSVKIWKSINDHDFSVFTILMPRGYLRSEYIYYFVYKDAMNKLDGIECEFAKNLYNLSTSYEKRYHLSIEN